MSKKRKSVAVGELTDEDRNRFADEAAAVFQKEFKESRAKKRAYSAEVLAKMQAIAGELEALAAVRFADDVSKSTALDIEQEFEKIFAVRVVPEPTKRRHRDVFPISGWARSQPAPADEIEKHAERDKKIIEPYVKQKQARENAIVKIIQGCDSELDAASTVEQNKQFDELKQRIENAIKFRRFLPSNLPAYQQIHFDTIR